jgi:crotonobetaine/carnitine-CoA ligase
MITELLQNRAAELPGKTFIVTPEGEYSFAQIDALTRRFAAHLAASGVVAGSHVALIAENSAAYLVAWFGINFCGAVAVTINNQLRGDGLRYTVDQCDACLLVVDRPWANSRLQDLDERQACLPRVVIESDQAWFDELAVFEPLAAQPVAPDRPCTILYTSGTTGLPKGVVNCHAAYLAVGRETVRATAITARDRIMVFLPLFHTNPQMYAVMSALTTGAALILLRRFSASTFFADAKRFDATGCTFVGTVLSILVHRHATPQRDHRVRFCFGGGAPNDVWRTVEERFGIKVHEAYGMTEVGGWASVNAVDDFRFGSCGRVRPDIEVQIVDAGDNLLPPGHQGEIVVRPRQPDVLLLGYYKRPEQMLESCRNFWFHTGDLGSFDADGYLYYHGRMKELIRHKGEMISPVEIETCLRRMPGVGDCAVVGVPDAVAGEEIKAVVVATSPLAARDVVNFLAAALPPFMLPRYVEFADAIPKTETEKIQRNKLVYVDGAVVDLRFDDAVRA